MDEQNFDALSKGIRDLKETVENMRGTTSEKKNEDLISIHDAREILGVTPATLYTYMRLGLLRYRTIGRKRYICNSEMKNILKRSAPPKRG